MKKTNLSSKDTSLKSRQETVYRFQRMCGCTRSESTIDPEHAEAKH